MVFEFRQPSMAMLREYHSLVAFGNGVETPVREDAEFASVNHAGTGAWLNDLCVGVGPGGERPSRWCSDQSSNGSTEAHGLTPCTAMIITPRSYGCTIRLPLILVHLRANGPRPPAYRRRSRHGVRHTLGRGRESSTFWRGMASCGSARHERTYTMIP